MSVNKVILVGNVGKDPETRYLDESTAITKFPMATSETYKNKNGERVSTTEWHNIVLWRGLAQVAEKYVKKGTQIYIEGRIKTRSYDDADGNKKYITEIVGDQMTLLGRKPDDGAGGGQSQGGAQAQSGAQAPAAGQAPAQAPAAGQAQGGAQAPAAGQAPAQADNAGGQQTPSAQPGDPFDGGDNGPDDLPF
jgi:single-strand DNA-binding protein